MCGIAGMVSVAGARLDELRTSVARMRDTMAHRGPDDFGAHVLCADASHHYSMAQPDGRSGPRAGGSTAAVALGSRRLAIIDLSPGGHQPMGNAAGTVWVVQNGEIYNFQELRKILEEQGYRFHGASDTEVLVHGYDAWGIDGLLARLRGMFVLALWDDTRGRLFLARDRYGIKPLYYAATGARLVFGSEVRAVVASGLVPDDADRRARVAFLLTGSVPSPWTTLAAVRLVPPGHYLAFDGGTRLVRYYTAPASAAMAAPDAREAIRQALDEAIELHLISDAPLGVFLSGGIDSSVVTALAALRRSAPLTTVSVMFEEGEYSEARYQRAMVARYHTDHREIMVTGADFWATLPAIFRAADQPSIDGMNTYFVSRAAREAGLTVVLSGLGGDEVFHGYPSFMRARPLRRVQRLPRLLRAPLRWSEWMPGRWRRLSYIASDDPLSLYLTLRGVFTPAETARILECDERQVRDVLADLAPGWGDEPPEQFVQRMEFDWYLQNQLLKDTDVMSMAHSIEIRVPLLDHHLVETVARVGGRPRTTASPKPLLTGAVEGLVPGEVIDRPKQGFVFPFARWLRDPRGRELVGGGAVGDDLWRQFQTGRSHWSRVMAFALDRRWAQRMDRS